jgi:hypothetical protein
MTNQTNPDLSGDVAALKAINAQLAAVIVQTEKVLDLQKEYFRNGTKTQLKNCKLQEETLRTMIANLYKEGVLEDKIQNNKPQQNRFF